VNPIERHGYIQLLLIHLQYIFFTSALACMIVIVWMPMYWLQAAVTVVLLTIAGSVCKSGRQ
jgi:hypothetical protein